VGGGGCLEVLWLQQPLWALLLHGCAAQHAPAAASLQGV
jgi:hypothetical protein